MNDIAGDDIAAALCGSFAPQTAAEMVKYKKMKFDAIVAGAGLWGCTIVSRLAAEI